LDDLVTRIIVGTVQRTEGPLRFRFILQPGMAVIFAAIDGLKDARTGKAPYFWSLITVPGHRAEMIREGWKSIGKVFILALVLDLIYQFIVDRSITLIGAILAAFVLAILPYLIMRGLISRLAPKAKA
jgi:hypothetical protein